MISSLTILTRLTSNEIVEAAEVGDSDKAIESDNADEVKEAMIALDEANDADEFETNNADLSVVETDEFD